MRLRTTLLLLGLLAACGGRASAAVPPVASAAPAAAPAAPRRTPTSAPTAPPTPTPSAVISDTAPISATATPDRASLHYVFPVRSAGKITYGRYHHDYPATDIFTAIGSVFRAPTSGVVDFVRREDRWDPKNDVPAERGGLAVAIIGDDGVRYYGSHLAQVADGIAPGVRVVAGQQLGLTGKTGDARFTAAHLHFGISHPTTPEDWQVRRGEIYPYKYLRCWQNPPKDQVCPAPADELFGKP